MYECVTLGWDNTARFGNRANIYIHFSLKQYYEWLKESIKRTREQFPPAHRLLFVNAWNEWAEGTYLEPDKLYGYAYLNTTSRALYGHPFMGSELESSHQAGAAKYSKDYEWLKQTIRAHGENSLTKVNSFIKDSEEILEFGPAAGYFTKFLKEERSAVVDIVEIDVECAKVAAPYARQCIVADLEKDDWASQLGSYRYNTILFADVLEHLRDPLSVLSKASRFLRPKGRIVISVPNLGHWQIVASLINNDFSYNNVGIMDKTHSHFFTEPTLREMVADAGLKVTNFTQVTMPHLPAGCGTKWNNCKVSWGMKRRLKKRPFADAIQIIAVCCRP
jgi:2-polyprenyl-3-methyl-5-hydroxy-6-metoxy-1,4-benzoquinol methylase